MKRLLLAAALAFAPSVTLAQVSIVDEGSFTIYQGGARLGHEDFRIRRMPVTDTSSEYVASSVVAYNDRRLAPDLRTGTRGEPLAYRVESRTGTTMHERLSGQTGRGRFSAVMKTPDGESTKEYALGEGALILEDEVFSQYYFVAQAGRNATVPVVVPRRSSQSTMHIESRGDEAVKIGGVSVPARHVMLRDAGGNDREIWVDSQGRVLKVSIPSRDLVAVRDEVPKG